MEYITKRIGIKRRIDMKLIILSFFLIGIVGCEKIADISDPLKYEKENLNFLYPRNWKVSEDIQDKNGLRYLFVESPASAILATQIYSKANASSLREFAEWYSSQRNDEIAIGDIEKTSFSTVEKIVSNHKTKGLREEFTITLLGIDTPHTCEYYIVNSGNKVAFLVSQSATEDLKKVKPGFDLILKTFMVK